MACSFSVVWPGGSWMPIPMPVLGCVRACTRWHVSQVALPGGGGAAPAMACNTRHIAAGSTGFSLCVMLAAHRGADHRLVWSARAALAAGELTRTTRIALPRDRDRCPPLAPRIFMAPGLRIHTRQSHMIFNLPRTEPLHTLPPLHRSC